MNLKYIKIEAGKPVLDGKWVRVSDHVVCKRSRSIVHIVFLYKRQQKWAHDHIYRILLELNGVTWHTYVILVWETLGFRFVGILWFSMDVPTYLSLDWTYDETPWHVYEERRESFDRYLAFHVSKIF